MASKHKAGRAIVTFIGLLGSAVTIFGSNHIYVNCIGYAAIWVLIIYWLWTVPTLRKSPPMYVALCFGMTVVLLAVSIPLVWDIRKHELAEATRGRLITTHGQRNDPIVLAIMPNSHWTWVGEKDKPQFGFPAGAKFNVRRNDDGELLINTEVHDRNGKMVVRIDDNVWTVNQSTEVCWDKNYTDDALEVKDGRGRVVLQIRVYSDVVFFNGEWWDEYGDGARIVNGLFVLMNPIRHPDEPHIEPLFLYPSRDHWAEWKQAK